MATAMESILGTWFISGLNVVGDEDGILTLRSDGRAVQFQSSITAPEMSGTMRLWYSCPDENSIRFRIQPYGESWTRLIESAPEGWLLVSDDNKHGRHEFPCTPAQPVDLPDWYSDEMERCLKRMAVMEAESEIEK